jgi:hypothetical protein
MDCLTVMPSGVVLALLRMQPRLEAEEAIAAASAAGTLTGEARAAALRALDGVGPSGHQRPKPNPDALVAHGFAMRRIKPRREKAET